MCFAMHCVASKVLAAKATKYQEDQYLRPIAKGRHITTLALSESGTGAHFFLPRSHYWLQGEDFVLDGQKSFVTSASHADSYVVSAVPPGAELDPGTFTYLVMDSDSPGIEWLGAWRGLGMRGNSSCAAKLHNVPIPRANLLGVTGDQIWYVFEIVTPYFLVAMAGVYVGIAQAALDLTIGRLQRRRHEHTGETLSVRYRRSRMRWRICGPVLNAHVSSCIMLRVLVTLGRPIRKPHCLQPNSMSPERLWR